MRMPQDPPPSPLPTRLRQASKLIATPSPSKLLLRRHLLHLQHALHPLLSVSSGASHPAFPRTILHYHLLTEAQLDSLAHWYHQRTPGPLSLSYPAPVITRWDRNAGIEDKRRRFGRFIGLRGCNSPQRNQAWVQSYVSDNDARESTRLNSDDDWTIQDCTTVDEMERVIEERIRRAIAREEERDMWKRKGF